MNANRAQRRAIKATVQAAAAFLASRCYDFQGGAIWCALPPHNLWPP